MVCVLIRQKLEKNDLVKMSLYPEYQDFFGLWFKMMYYLIIETT